MNYNKLPADPSSLILGILALILGIAGCCCYGIIAIIPLALSIIGLVMANKSLRLFAEDPDAFSPSSRSNVNTAKIINIIALVWNAGVFLVSIVFFIFYGAIMSTAVLDDMRKGEYNYDDYNYEEYENDSIYWDDEDIYIIEEEIDSTSLDSTETVIEDTSTTN